MPRGRLAAVVETLCHLGWLAAMVEQVCHVVDWRPWAKICAIGEAGKAGGSWGRLGEAGRTQIHVVLFWRVVFLVCKHENVGLYKYAALSATAVLFSLFLFANCVPFSLFLVVDCGCKHWNHKDLPMLSGRRLASVSTPNRQGGGWWGSLTAADPTLTP